MSAAVRIVLAVILVALAGACGGDRAPAPPPPSAPGPTSPTRTATPAPPTSVGTTAVPAPATRSPASGSATTTPAPRGSPFPARLAGQDVERLPTRSRTVALTFDAGANSDGVSSILATLARDRVPATFFLTGQFAARFPDPARRIVRAGHRLGDHSVDHPYFTALTTAQIRAQVLGAARTIRAVTGADPAPLFRFPYGDSDARTVSTVNGVGYLPVRWTVDSLGWQGRLNGTRAASFVTTRVLGAATPGMIVLMHVGSHPTDHSTLDADALPSIIAGLRQRGYGFATLDALLR